MVFLIPYAYDRLPDGKPRIGVPARRLGSKSRCDALLLKTDPYYIFVLTAGFSKKSHDQPTETEKEALCEQMEKYLRSRGSLFFISKPRTWGTYGETLESIMIMSPFSATRPIEICVSTNLGHMPRVWLCWFFLKPKGWKVRFVIARHSFTPKEWWQETFKFFVYLYRFIFEKW